MARCLARSALSSELGAPGQGRAISSLITGVSQLRTSTLQMSTDAAVVSPRHNELQRCRFESDDRVAAETKTEQDCVILDLRRFGRCDLVLDQLSQRGAVVMGVLLGVFDVDHMWRH